MAHDLCSFFFCNFLHVTFSLSMPSIACAHNMLMHCICSALSLLFFSMLMHAIGLMPSCLLSILTSPLLLPQPHIPACMKIPFSSTLPQDKKTEDRIGDKDRDGIRNLDVSVLFVFAMHGMLFGMLFGTAHCIVYVAWHVLACACVAEKDRTPWGGTCPSPFSSVYITINLT